MMLVLLLWILLRSQSVVGQYQNCSQGGPPEVVPASRGTVESPNYPGDYPHYANCDWIIILPESRGVVDARFRSFNVESCSNCGCDYLRIYNGGTRNDPIIGTYCGSSLPAPFISSSNQVLLEFRTDGSIAYSGFQLVFEIRETACSGQVRAITSAPGEIQTRFHPYFNYDHNLNCQWRLVASPDQIVHGYLETFVTEGCCDILTIYDGPDSSDPVLARLGGTWSGYQFFSTQSAVYLHFRTDGSINYIGFRLHFVFMGASPTTEAIDWTPRTEGPGYTETDPTQTWPSETPTVRPPTGVGTWPPTTPRPVAPPGNASNTDLIFQLHLNGTFRTVNYAPIDNLCASGYGEELRRSADTAVADVNVLLADNVLCPGLQTAVTNFDVIMSTISSWGYVTILFHIPADRSHTFDSVANCGRNIGNYLSDHGNWNQPIIGTPVGCEEVVFDPPSFNTPGNQWFCVERDM